MQVALLAEPNTPLESSVFYMSTQGGLDKITCALIPYNEH